MDSIGFLVLTIFESLSWLAYALLVGNWSAWIFLFVSSGQMWLWAVKTPEILEIFRR